MSEIRIIKGDLIIEINLTALLDSAETITESKPEPVVETVVEPVVEPQDKPRRGRPKKVVAVEPVEEIVEEPVEVVPTTVTELKTWFLQNEFNLESIAELLNNKYNVTGLGRLTDDQAEECYRDLLKLKK